ncbi:MAG TPA: protoporphyrinogen oxidase [Candidatus Dormibacteraeota bacterium]|nr:protoporphyrinogen oxidase [Candidatus Dormibacteraeota bacterium]
MTAPARRLAIIGAGVSGLAAAAELARLAEEGSTPLDLSVFEADARPGGKIQGVDFGSARVDLGAESLLARDPGVEALVERLGLGSSLVRPATTSAAIWNGRRLVALPKTSVLGVPLYPWRRDVVRAVGVAGAVRAALEPLLGRGDPEPDGALGVFLSSRVGKAVFRRLVDPLLGGVYAGPAAPLSSAAVAPQLVAAAEGGGSLLRALRRSAATRPRASDQTPFVSFQGGLEELTKGLLGLIPKDSLLLGRAVDRLEGVDSGRIRVHVAAAPSADFDGLILAVPAPAAALVMTALSPAMGSLLRQLEYASVATVTLAYPEEGFSRPLVGSGFLATRRQRRTLTACTFLDHKWPHLRRPGRTLLRASAGSFGEEWVLALDDTTLVSSIHRELRSILGLTELPIEVRVERWHGALPQYRAGHLAWRAQVEEMAATLPAPIELTGAAFGGVGVASCLRDGATAARSLWSRTGPA